MHYFRIQFNPDIGGGSYPITAGTDADENTHGWMRIILPVNPSLKLDEVRCVSLDCQVHGRFYFVYHNRKS